MADPPATRSAPARRARPWWRRRIWHLLLAAEIAVALAVSMVLDEEPARAGAAPALAGDPGHGSPDVAP